MSEPPDISRRTFVLGTPATVAMSAAGASTPVAGANTPAAGAKAPAAGVTGLWNLSAVEAVTHMSQGALTSEQYAQAPLERCQSAPALNAFITLEPARVLEAARARDH